MQRRQIPSSSVKFPRRRRFISGAAYPFDLPALSRTATELSFSDDILHSDDFFFESTRHLWRTHQCALEHPIWTITIWSCSLLVRSSS
ncbi:hypothetical protein M6B38_136485 [Iris pallida]|uniref:Uncharacterized protein n=1 Tax=Iris pallida TaxID=29817 RepID=A0AAX6FF54_IRIPA|nr:hypothetical protein M6B38_136485 [Iris pallida]